MNNVGEGKLITSAKTYGAATKIGFPIFIVLGLALLAVTVLYSRDMMPQNYEGSLIDFILSDEDAMIFALAGVALLPLALVLRTGKMFIGVYENHIICQSPWKKAEKIEYSQINSIRIEKSALDIGFGAIGGIPIFRMYGLEIVLDSSLKNRVFFVPLKKKIALQIHNAVAEQAKLKTGKDYC